jgi:hypothetical protein
MANKRIDEATGVETVGHSWDGIEELNNPLPRWWLWTLYATIVFSIGYVIVYPAIPMVNKATEGLWGWSSRGQLAKEMKAEEQRRAGTVAALAAKDLEIGGEWPWPTLTAATYGRRRKELYGFGAGTGVGKGIVLAGGMADAYHQDGVKRFLWLSVSNDLIESSARDLKDVGLGFLPLNQLNEFGPDEQLAAKMGKGVVFATYSTLIAKSKRGQTRLKQLADWLGNDGYVVFDEGHKAANALAGTLGLAL